MKTLNDIKQENNEKEVLIQLKDAFVSNISEDGFGYSGCETCDYGSEYGVEYIFTFNDGHSLDFKFSDMYDAPISEGQMMTFLLTNLEEFKEMTKNEFIEFILKEENVIG